MIKYEFMRNSVLYYLCVGLLKSASGVITSISVVAFTCDISKIN